MQDKLVENNHPKNSFPHMKKRLKEYFDNKIIITDINAKPNMIAFYSTASATLQQFYQQQRNEDTEKEKLRLVETALIVEERSHSTSPRRTYFFHLHIWNPESV